MKRNLKLPQGMSEKEVNDWQVRIIIEAMYELIEKTGKQMEEDER